MATKRSVQERLEAIIFIPPKSIHERYDILKALNVQGANGRAEAEFTSINSGITKKFINKCIPQQIQAFEEFSSTDKVEETKPDQFAVAVHLRDAMNGSLGATVRNKIRAMVKGESEKDSGHVLNFGNMEEKSLEPTSDVADFLRACLKDFCEYSEEIRSFFAPTPTRTSGAMEYGLAFVLCKIKGTVHIQEEESYHLTLSTEGETEGVKMDGSAKLVSSKQEIIVGSGVIGAHVHYFRLLKTRKNPVIRIKEDFPVRSSYDERLRRALGSMAAKIRRKITGPNPVPPIVLATAKDYDPPGNYRQYIESLEERADEDTAFQRDPPEVEQLSSLRIVGEDDDNQKVSSGSLRGPFTSSNNILFESSLEDLVRIDKAIKDNGSTTVGGKVVDAIKPVIKGKIVDSLPIMYKEDLSGTPFHGDVPGWVLREERDGELLMFWCVSGLETNSGIVSAHDYNDWHVRESIEYVEKANTKLMEELKGEGFFQLHPDEADPDEIEPSHVKDGSIVMFGRHVLALKHFNGPDDAEGEDVGDVS